MKDHGKHQPYLRIINFLQLCIIFSRSSRLSLKRIDAFSTRSPCLRPSAGSSKPASQQLLVQNGRSLLRLTLCELTEKASVLCTVSDLRRCDVLLPPPSKNSAILAWEKSNSFKYDQRPLRSALAYKPYFFSHE